MLTGAFAATAVLLAALGIHGYVLRLGMKPVLFGLVAGLATALGGGRVLNSLLFETYASDPAILTAVAVAIMLIALAACYLPSRRATKVDPMIALRAE